MSLPLKPFRLGITAETWLALKAMSEGFKRDMREVAREVLHEWAMKKQHEYTVATKLLRVEKSKLSSGGSAVADAGKSLKDSPT